MEIFKTWHELFGLRFCPITLIQIGFSAGTVYLLLALQACSGVRVAKKELDHAISHEKLVAEYLHEVGRSWPGANKIVEILKNLVQKKLTPLLDKIPVLDDGVSTPEIQEDEYSAPPVVSRSPRVGRVQQGHKPPVKNKKQSGGQPVLNQPSPFSLPSPAIPVIPPSHSAGIPIPIHNRAEPSDSGFVMVNSPGATACSPGTNAEVATFNHAPPSHDHSMFQSYPPPESVDHPSTLLYVASHPMEGYADQSVHNPQAMPSTWPSWYPNIGFLGMPQGQTLPDAPFWNQISIEEQTSPLLTAFDKFIANHPPFISSVPGGSNDHMDTDVSMDERNSWCRSVNQIS